MSVIETHSALRSRLMFFYGVVVVMIAVLFSGLAYRQLFSQEAFAERERMQNRRRILIPGPRGEIFDREGRVLVANRARFSAVLFLSDKRVREQFRAEYRDLRDGGADIPRDEWEHRARANVVQRYLNQCNRILRRQEVVDAAAVQDHFIRNPLLPFTVLDDVEPAEFAALVEQLPVNSPLQIFTSTARHYPFGRTAAHTLGYVSYTAALPDENLPGGDLKTFHNRGSYGREGLEARFDDQLQGKPGSQIWIVDPAGYQVEMIEQVAPSTGRPLYTSLDIDLQLAGEAAFGDKEGAAVAIDVRTGEVLALISKPDYDLNDTTPFIPTTVWNDIMEREAFLNRATQGLYPPGSTFKLLTAIAGLRAGTFPPEREVTCNHTIMVSGRPFSCMGRHGPISLVGAIRQSCNVYFYEEALATGPEKIADEARRFALGRPTGIELPETRRMVVPDPAWKRNEGLGGWVPGDTANVAIGQGYVEYTPLQMACFTASLARNETITNPTILRRAPGASPAQAGNQSLGLAPSHRAAMLQGMEEAVLRGTANKAHIEGLRLAGKTGTAQKEVWEEGRKRILELAWTTVFGPVENPSIAVTVLVVGDRPDEVNPGGRHAAPIAKAILEAYFKKHPPLPAVRSSLFGGG